MAAANETHRENVKIPSATRGWDLDAWRYLPAARAPNSAARPCAVIIMAHGLTGNKTMGLDAYARAFAAEGYACVVFDYRRWGASDGTARDSVFVSEQLEDYRTVLKWCRQQREFDPHRVVVWGTSFAGGHAVSLASEGRLALACAVAQCPYLGENPPTSLSFTSAKLVALALWDLLKQALGGAPVYIPGVARPGAVGVMTVRGSVEGIFRLGGKYPNRMAASSLLEIPFYNPSVHSDKISCPVLVIPCAGDGLCPWKGAAVLKHVKSQGGEVVEVPGDHFAVYPGQAGHEASLKAQVEFLQKHVPV